MIFKFVSSDKIKFISSSEDEKKSNKATFPHNEQITLPNLQDLINFLILIKKNLNKLKLVFFQEYLLRKVYIFF